VNSGELKGDVKVVYDKIPITYLNEDQEISLTATAKLGRGVEHAKFNPGFLYYRNICEISLDGDLIDEVKKAFPNAKINEKGNKIVVLDDGVKESCDAIEGIAESKGKSSEIATKEGLVVTLESFGQLGVKEIFKKTVEELKKDLAETGKKLK
jgi:DNA-directed RNA polymerase subunit D